MMQKTGWHIILGLSLWALFYPPSCLAFCYYIIDSNGDVYSSIYPPYDLSFPPTQPLSKEEMQRRKRIGYLSITVDKTGCNKEPFSFNVLNPQDKPQVSLPESANSPLPEPEDSKPKPKPPAPIAEPQAPAPAIPTSTPTAVETAAPQGMSVMLVQNTLDAMDVALSKKDLQTYQHYLASELSISKASGEGDAPAKTLSKDDYVSDLQQQLQRVSRYNISHQNSAIHIDAEANTAKVKSLVKLNGEYKNALPIDTSYNETALFVWDAKQGQALLKELTMQSGVGMETAALPAPTPAAPTTTSDANVCQSAKGLPQTECEILVQLHENTNGKLWQNTQYWLQNKEPCQWSGIICDAGHVIEINLVRKNLQGRLPNLSGLAQLQVLNLRNNKLNGEIPDLSNLTQLKSLDLSRNNFIGTLPNFASLKKLESLEVYKNSLFGELPDFSTASQIKKLDLSSNQFTNQIPDLSKLNQLKELNLSNNQLSGELKGLAGLSSVTELLLHKNSLNGNVTDIGNLKQVRKLYLSDNEFSGALPDLSNLRWLEILSVANNKLSGTLPASLNQLEDVEWLQMDGNQFSGMIPDLSKLKRLKIFSIANNQLCGAVPDWLLHSNLKRDTSSLQLSNNRLTASSPEMQKFLEQKEPGWATSQQATGNCP